MIGDIFPVKSKTSDAFPTQSRKVNFSGIAPMFCPDLLPQGYITYHQVITPKKQLIFPMDLVQSNHVVHIRNIRMKGMLPRRPPDHYLDQFVHPIHTLRQQAVQTAPTFYRLGTIKNHPTCMSNRPFLPSK